MHAIYQFLADAPLVYLFLAVGVGMAFGHIKFRGISLGAAAVLFFAIALTAIALAGGVELHISHEVGSLGLAMFAFAIGITSGPNFFHVMRTSGAVVLAMVLILLASAGVAFGLGRAFGMDIALIAGTFAGAITNTPALAAAGAASGDPATATVGYSIAYLFGVLGMLAFSMMALSYGRNDTDAPSPLVNRTVRIDRDDNLTLAEVQAELGESVQFSRIRRGELGPITNPRDTDRIARDDLLTLVGPTEDVARAIDFLGHASSHSLLTDRRYLDFRRVTVSNPRLAGRTVGEIDLEGRFGGTISRVRRGDVDMVGEPGLTLVLGDRARVVAPTSKMDEISKFFGDSSRGLSDINPVALGLGMALGLVIGGIGIPMPGGGTFSIGSAAGTLIMGLIMGRVGRIGNVTTALPQTACNVLSEFGLLVFLAYAGTNAGGQIANAFASGAWTQILVVGAATTTTVGLGLYMVMRYLVRMGGTRLAGVMGGTQTQPAVLAFANMRTGADPRVALGYAMVYPVSMIAKILIAQILGSF
ncbi:MAG TPA: transporter [Actinomycetales bacterium]|nr:transporter [Actinomycetales bacterium]